MTTSRFVFEELLRQVERHSHTMGWCLCEQDEAGNDAAWSERSAYHDKVIGMFIDLEERAQEAEDRAKGAELECKVLTHGQVTEYRRGYNLGLLVSGSRPEKEEDRPRQERLGASKVREALRDE